VAAGVPPNYFKPEEFQCPCCGKGTVDPALKAMLNTARGLAGVPFVLTSAYRCPKHNAKVGGSPTSSHLKGFAVDISTPDSTTRFAVLCGLIKAGFTRMEFGLNYIHADIDPSKPRRVASFNRLIRSVKRKPKR